MTAPPSPSLGRPLQTILSAQRASRAPLADFAHYYAGVDVAFDAQRNLAFTGSAPSVSPRLTAHAQRMGQKIYRVADVVYCAVGYAIANVIFVVGKTGIVVVDTTESVDAALLAKADFEKACPQAAHLPYCAVVYTHNHSDHINGVRAFATDAAVASGACQIIAHDSLMEAVRNNASVVAPILRVRSAYTFGALLEPGPLGAVQGGIGPVLARGKASFIAPTLTFAKRLQINLAGIDFDFHHAPSETDDELIAWLPALNVLLSAEVIQGECLANVHTLRGTRYRDPQQWVRSIDAMRAQHEDSPAAFMVPAHGRPVAGAANISELLTAYRDAIAFIHDQSVRLINQGARPDELADLLPALPPHLASHAWLGEYYGTVKHCARQIFSGQLGWFDGDPATLDPLPPLDKARRWLALIGGRDAALQAAQAAANSADTADSSDSHQDAQLDEARWAAELASLLVRADPTDAAAKACKAQAFKSLGYASDNINWRNWYLTASRELDGAYDKLPIGANSLANEDILQALAPRDMLELLAVRLAAERCLDVQCSMVFELTDMQRQCVLEIRHGILQISEHDMTISPRHLAEKPQNTEKPTPTLSMERASLPQLLQGGIAGFAALMQAGKVSLSSGELADLAAFFSYFDPKAERLPKLASR